MYNETIGAIIDKHAPLTTRTVTVRPHTPWYNDSIRSQKCVRRQLERRWKTSGLECDGLAYCLQRQSVTSSIHRTQLEYHIHMSQIADASGDQKKLFGMSPNFYTPIMTLHFRRVSHSTHLQSSFKVFSRTKYQTSGPNLFKMLTT